MGDPDFKKHVSLKKPLIVIGIILLFVLGAGLGFWLGNGYSAFTGASVSNNGSPIEDGDITSASPSIDGTITSDVTIPAVESKPLVVKVDVNSIPTLSGAAQAQEIVIQSNNLNAYITSDSEQLKITPLENAKLKLESFSGSMNFNSQTVALHGKISKLEINGVVLSMPNLEINIEDSGYDLFQLQGLSSSGFTITNGKGTLLVDNTKNSYEIDIKDTLVISSFEGAVSADKTAAIDFTAEGTVKQVRATGSIDLTLK